MSARAIQDQKAIAPETLVQQSFQRKPVIPAGALQGTRLQPSKCDLITFSTMPKRSSWANHSTGRSPEFKVKTESSL